jgi:hypothetical protein
MNVAEALAANAAAAAAGPAVPDIADFPQDLLFNELDHVVAAFERGKLKPEHLKQAMYAVMYAGGDPKILEFLKSKGAPTDLAEYNLRLFTDCGQSSMNGAFWFLEQNLGHDEPTTELFKKFMTAGSGTYFTPMLFYPVMNNNWTLFQEYMSVDPDLSVVGLLQKDFKTFYKTVLDVASQHADGKIFDELYKRGAPSGSSAAMAYYAVPRNFKRWHPTLVRDPYNFEMIEAFGGNSTLAREMLRESRADLFKPIDDTGATLFSTAIFNYSTSSEVKSAILWPAYEAKYGKFDAAYTYTGEKGHLMFSQRGVTCAPDALFTMIMESDYIGDVFEVADLDKITAPAAGSRAERYLSALKGAKKRYTRMFDRSYMFRGFSGMSYVEPRLRRTFSVANNLGEKVLMNLTSCEMPIGTLPSHIHEFLDSVLIKNELAIPWLSEMKFNVRLASEMRPDEVLDLDKVSFLLLNCVPLGDVTAIGHAVGIFQRVGKWFYVDNEVGYLHEFKDLVWLKTILIPRLLKGVKTFLSGSRDFFSTAVLAMGNEFPGSFLKTHFITLGDKCYPNIRPDGTIHEFGVYLATEIEILSHEDISDNVVVKAIRNAKGGALRKRKNRLTTRRSKKLIS